MASDKRGPILLVDDEPRVLGGLRRMLDDHWDVLEATCGDLALRILEENDVAILISDVVMPRMDGLSLLAQVESLSPETVRILLTGRGDYGIAVRAVNQAHAFGFLQKPCPAEELEAMLEQAEAEYGKHLVRSRAVGRADRLQNSLRDIARVVEQVGIPLEVEDLPRAALPELASLSAREWEVVRLLLQGHRAPHIARVLVISAHTVRSHLRRVFQKLDVRSQEELVARIRGVAP